MDPAEIVAERKIEDAIGRGAFDDLPSCGRIDCSLTGEYFIAQWWRNKIIWEEHAFQYRKILK